MKNIKSFDHFISLPRRTYGTLFTYSYSSWKSAT